MILGVDATSSTLQYGFVSKADSIIIQKQAMASIETLPALISSLLSKYKLKPTGLLTVLGPGSYTGIRLSLAALKMCHMTYNVPLIGKSLFELYMDINHHLLNQLIVLTSNSRKGQLNVQIFQTNSNDYHHISSILQLSFDQFKSFINKFEAPITWHHIGDECHADVLSTLTLDRVTIKQVEFNLLAAIKQNQSSILNLKKQGSLLPIYST